MASTDAKSGFRLPWSTDRNESDEQVDTSGGDPTTADPDQAQSESETSTMIDPAPTAPGEAGQDEPAATREPVAGPEDAVEAAGPASSVARKPNKFMADLTRAMQAAAESARTDTLERFSMEAKAHIESIHASTADESTGLRKKADEDIATIREWSKAEIARIREETDERVNHRKDVLEREIESHAAGIESRIERVQARVSSFEADMDDFFERLLAENDPTRFAAMAESLPEPPPFDADAAWDSIPSRSEIQTPTETPFDAGDTSAVAIEEPVEVLETVDDPVAETNAVDTFTDETPVSEAEPADTGDLFGVTADDPAPIADDDPRLSALALDPDFAAAEAEAAEYPVETPSSLDDIPVIAEDALAARLAGLVAEDHTTEESATTRVIVSGLVSVASIAGFKRNLARVAGVRTVGVSSGPDGEFVFGVVHDTGLTLAEAIATLPGFSARVTNETAGELTVAARDPETEG
jgi:hypothetical protein